MAQHQLNDPNVDAVCKQPTRALVPEVVPPQVDSSQLLLVPCQAFLSRSWFDAVRQELQRLPGRLNRRLVGSVGAPEDVGIESEFLAAFEDGRQPSSGIKR